MQLVRIALQGVVGFPLRTALSCLSLLVGVTGVVSVYAASGTVEATVVQDALLTGGPVATVDLTGPSGAASLEQAARARRFAERILGPGSRSAVTASLESARVTVAGRQQDADVVFAEPRLRRIRPFPLLQGTWLSEEPQLVLGLVVNRVFAADYAAGAGSEAALGGTALDADPARIVGVVDDGAQAPTVYASLAETADLLRVNGATLHAGIELTAPDVSASGIQDRLRQFAEQQDDGVLWKATRRDTIAQQAAEVTATRSSFLSVGVLGLLATAFAIANVGLSALRERTNELSIRRALGASRRAVPLIMLVESQIIALAAGALAVPASALLYLLIAKTFGAPYGVSPPPYPWAFAVLGVLVGMVTALVGSLAPAWRALRTPIAAVMRE